ncbi:site-specific recombinase XerD [Sphingobacterium allocomposti]|uniref:Site-specific recombinase XerD n=1 Tax=Sphingobacterium allocomposti TaxID=415956 RepID=A0A5S5D040_9SPHI|nr:site-specific integrase [Sphingobacterium composti Yoo et al. 2007 non Ten et al. 2007]TYP89407.1 site-specific recombinase XerD [Sphingobacterium composti Yoo et al. 2007 non Ten et al. 2007]
MATITPTILQNNRRKDGRWVVVYRLTHRRQSVYIKTSNLIGPSQLNKDNTIKQKYVIDYLASEVKLLEHRIASLGLKAERYTAAQLKEYILASDQDVDFLQFCDEHYEVLKRTLKPNTVGTYRTTINHLKDFQGNKKLFCREITSAYVKRFMEYVQEPKTIVRMVGEGSRQTSLRKSRTVSGNSLYTIFFRFRKLFDWCKERYNDEDMGIIRIPNSPFDRVPAPKMQATKKRSISVEDIRKIRDYQPVSSTEMAAKNLFMLSFYLCGINMIDIRNNISSIGKRLEYYRSKVERRNDRGFISIKIPKEAKPYMQWYIEVKDRWSNSKNMTFAANKGLKSMSEKLDIDPNLSTYYARHSFATIGRNDCRIPEEYISRALNHVGSGNRVTDIYLAPDWSIIDEVQEKVINKINEDIHTK